MEGTLISPQNFLCIDFCMDSDFAVLFTLGEKQDPVSVELRTGYVIFYKGAPLLWAKYFALTQAVLKLFPFSEVLEEIMSILFQVSETISYHTYSKSVYSNDNYVEKYKFTTNNCV
jgi:hypothetical protein